MEHLNPRKHVCVVLSRSAAFCPPCATEMSFFIIVSKHVGNIATIHDRESTFCICRIIDLQMLSLLIAASVVVQPGPDLFED